MTEQNQYRKPSEIEKRSFEIIGEILGERTFPPLEEPIIKRVIHTTADFDYADNLKISAGAVEAGLKALQSGVHIVTDTTMALSGINKKIVTEFGGQVHCFIGEEEVAKEAERKGVTRSRQAVDKAVKEMPQAIFVIGNAPTALIRLHELTEAGKASPALVIGAPVGFVNVIESKELWLSSKVPYMIARGRKGGSNVAAAIVNALLYMIVKRQGDS